MQAVYPAAKENWCYWLSFVGVKNADENELRSIASDPDEIHMYNVLDFSFLLDIVDDLTNNLCASVKGPGNLKDSYVMWALKKTL